MWIFLKDGFSVDANGVVSMSADLYLYNFLNQMIFAILLVVGVILVLLGMVQGAKGCSKAILPRTWNGFNSFCFIIKHWFRSKCFLPIFK